jgi:endonuclease/exonuclease/phosphatase family metal-dependent hydrolase
MITIKNKNSKQNPPAYLIVRGIARRKYKKTEPHIRVMTFNVHFGEDTAAISKAINENENLRSADIILLQEVEHHEIEKIPRAQLIAEKLDMHFAYAPARNLYRKAGTHGLATLSRYPILDAEIIRLTPYKLIWRTSSRIALNITVDIDGTPFKIINVHLDTRISARERLDQLKPVVERALSGPEGKMLIAGDFNTLPVYFIKRMVPAFLLNQKKIVDSYFSKNGFKTQIKEIKYTMRKGYIHFKLDSIYVRGTEATRYGMEKDVTVSDHQPLWADISL